MLTEVCEARPRWALVPASRTRNNPSIHHETRRTAGTVELAASVRPCLCPPCCASRPSPAAILPTQYATPHLRYKLHARTWEAINLHRTMQEATPLHTNGSPMVGPPWCFTHLLRREAARGSESEAARARAERESERQIEREIERQRAAERGHEQKGVSQTGTPRLG